ncbi:cell adhesion molecule Dscam1 isoform X1 [Parasteatoda tepidariorum]|uniref:cell adhesion molecule Dscam1 isoform X1 n=1 Tax=Parasteatoda tepidariorum TaxID=114398 RepID=UPI00077F942D|nr:Down syndrome cell adhesion molecule-like protein Dscam2 [Parasteatoda tepidariorum]
MTLNWNTLIRIYFLIVVVSSEMPHHRAPIFTFEPPSLNVFSNSSGSTIPCNADGRPSPIIRWLKHDGLPALDLPGLRHVRHDGALVFPPFPAEDYRADVHATVYRCEVSNSVGTLGSRDVHVRAVVNQKYEIRLSDEFVLRGNMALLRCPVPSFVSDYVKVTSWERIDGFLITPGIISGKYGILQNGDLYIRDTTEHDSAYSFRCHTENTVTREKKVSTNYAKVIVTEPHHNQPPRIMIRSSRVSVPVGRKATLSCLAQGHPTPTYRWHKVAGELRSVPELGSTVRQEGGVLVFHKVVPADGGTYICEVSNSVGQDKVEAELIIEEPIHVNIYPPEQKLDVGKTANFNCSIQGHPIASVTWRKDMRILNANQRIIIPTPTSLQVRQVKRSDSGVYQCFVNRDDLSVQASAKLTIGDLAPKFTVTFPEKILRPGSYVSLVCVASGNPAPQIKWYLDRIWPVSTRPGTLVSTYLSSSGEVVSYLNFTSIDVSDSGLYQCEAFNEAGSIQHSKRLNVFGPLFIRPLSNLTALAESRFAVYCPFGGFPFDNIVWKKEGRILPVNQRQRVYPNGTLVIEGVQPRVDDGRYSCEVASSQGMPISRSFRILVRTGPKVASFSFKDNLHEGMLTAVTCIVDAGDGPLTTRWLKDGQILLEEDLDATIMYAQEGHVSTLTIKKLEHKHNGNYTCASTNDVATGSYSAILTVKVPPRWILEPSDITAVSGRPATISCQADGEPHPHIRWKKTTDHPPDQFKTIVSSSHVHILVNGSLNFPSVEASDEGYYLCEANNGVGPGLSTVVKLTVHSAPQFQFKFKVLGARRGDKTVIECSSYGNRPMNFIWRRQGVIVDPISEPRYRILEEELLDGDRSKMIIEKAERKDSALFTCTAVNDYGEDSLNIQLTVQDIPDAPQNLEIHDISSRNLRLTWNKPFDGNSPILQYTVMWRNVNDDNSAGGPVTVPGSETTVTIRGLKPKTRYFFRVKCQNSLGESQFGAEVAATTLEEPPRHPPENIKATVVSSRSINVTWNMPQHEEGGNIEGFYIGYKLYGSSDAYTFKPIESSYGRFQQVLLSDLNRFTEYSIVVQSFNSRGAGPPSEEIMSRTLEFDPPGVPVIKTYYATATTIKVSWELNIIPSAPVTGYVLHHKLEDQNWHDTHLNGDQSVYTLKDLQCGSTYYIYLVAFNTVSHGNSSEIISAKTNGNAPIAPDKRMLLSVNKTTVTVNLNSWHNGGCPITFFIIQYKAAGHQEWTLVSNNIIPEQQTITITDLNPGTWYSILMTARNDAGATDAEYVFATLTLTGEYPPRPSEMSDVNGSFYRHLTITVPVISSTIVLVAVLCVVCIITRRRTSGRTPRTPDGTSSRDPSKPDSMPLSVTYDSSQEPTYYPSPYATSNTAGYNREQCFQSNHQQNTGTIGSNKCGYSYDVPYLQRREEKFESSYQSSIVYLPAYHRTGHQLLIHQEQAIYEVPDLGRRKQDCNRSSRENGYRRSSIESDDENEDDLILTSKDRIFEEARESETECDRLWKNFQSSQYEEGKRWSSDRERVVLT